MISQTAPEGEPHFVLTMAEHTQMCGQMARAFGNDRFEPPAPFDEVVYIVENHDRGWDPYDANPGLDPTTRVPYIMARTPTPDAVKTNRGSDRKSTRLNSSHMSISYAVFCLKKKKKK